VAALAALAVGASACASTSPDEPFRDTASLVNARSGHALAWSATSDGDDAVESERAIHRRVQKLLEGPLDVNRAVQVALLSNRNLQATFEELSVAQADLVQAGLLSNPVVGGAIGFPVLGSVRTGLDLSLSQDFVGVLFLAAKKKVARSALRAAELHVGQAALDLVFETEAAFYRATAAGQIAEMRRLVAEAGDAALDLTERQAKAGNLSELDRANQASLYEQVKTDLVQSDAEALAAREALTRKMGLADAQFQLLPRLPELPAKDPDLHALEDAALRSRLDVAAAQADAETLARALDLAGETRWLSTFDLGVDYERAPEHFSTVGPAAQLELPIFDQKQAKVATLRARYRAARDRQAALVLEARSEVRETAAKVTAMRRVVELYTKTLVPLREQAVRLSQTQYDAMLLGVYPLIQAKENEIDAYRALLEANREYWVARAALERATGGGVR
jgi:cobalt-zinc-cadmium efflux system outer membrane protein